MYYHEQSMNRVNQIALDRNEYSSDKEFRNAIKKTIMLLIDNGYVATVKYDDGKELGIVAIHYDYDGNFGFGNPLPYWLMPRQFEEFMDYMEGKKNCVEQSSNV